MVCMLVFVKPCYMIQKKANNGFRNLTTDISNA
jgi:hypothetical protein